MMLRGNAPRNAGWTGCSTKIVFAAQKKAANVVGVANANIDARPDSFRRNSGRTRALLPQQSRATNKPIYPKHLCRALAAAVARAHGQGRPSGVSEVAGSMPERVYLDDIARTRRSRHVAACGQLAGCA